jgi:hypothetical protein
VAQPVLPFAEFLEELRRQGFVIGLDQHLRMQLLLDRLAESCPPERLKTHLCPIFATSPEEQGRFHRAFDRFYPAFVSTEGETEREERRSQGTESLMPERRAPETLRRRLLLMLAVAATLAGLWFWWRSNRKVEPAPAPTPTADTAAAPQQPSPGDTTVAPAPTIADSAPQPAPAPAPEPEIGGESFLSRHRTAIRLLTVLLPVVLFLLNEWRLYRRRRLVIERQRRQKPPFSWPVRLEAPVNPFTESAELPTAARHLRQREAGEVERLAVEDSVSATIAALGFPTFRYKTDTRAPEYLLLIEREAHRDHRARLFQSLAQALEREGVHTTRYFFDADPRVCYAEDGQHHELLVDIRRRYPGHRLLLFGRGESLVDPLSGRLTQWTTEYLSWSDRALLTPESPSSWGVRELALAQHFVVLPATTAGLMGVVEHFRGPVRPDPGRWEEDNPSPGAPRLDDGDPLPRLGAYLGPRVFRWLCACAVYPELHWDLTLHLGSLPELGPGLITEEHLLRLLRLPWYRQGAIPDEVRARLIDQLNEAEERAVRQAIVELLERNPAPEDSVSANRYDLDLVVQRLALGRRDLKQRAAALRELQSFPRRELVQDFAMVKLLEETPSSRLAVILPRRLRRVFYRDGVPALGPRAALRVAVAVSVMGLGLLYLRQAPAAEYADELTFGLPGSFNRDTLFLLPGEERSLPEARARVAAGNSIQGSAILDSVSYRSLDPAIAQIAGDAIVGRGTGLTRLVATSPSGKGGVLPVKVEAGRWRLNGPDTLTSGSAWFLLPSVPSQGKRWITSGIEIEISDTTVARFDGLLLSALRPGVFILRGHGFGQDETRRVVVVDSGATAVAGGRDSTTTGLVDERPAVELAVREYARALEASDLKAMLAVYPTMPPSMRTGYEAFFASHRTMVTNRWQYAEITVSGDSALARVSGESLIRDSTGRWYSSQPVSSSRTISLVKTSAKTSGRWQITGIEAKGPRNVPTEALTYYSRGLLHQDQGDTAKAREAFTKALSVFSEYQEARAALDNLTPVSDGSGRQATTVVGVRRLGATLQDLQRLDSLRTLAKRGSRSARTEYFRQFDSLLLKPTLRQIVGALRNLPPQPNDSSDYAWSYALLHAHLVTTSFPEKSAPDFLAPVLGRVWSELAQPSGYVSRLAQTQFEFYAAELPRSKLLPLATDSSAVLHARAFLQRFTGGEQIYQIMLSAAARSQGARPFDFNKSYPNPAVSAAYLVPAAFTRRGWAFMQDSAFKNTDQFFKGEEWVLGGETLSERERRDITNRVKAMYRTEYVRQWQTLLSQARIAPFGGIADASRKLLLIGGNPSPLLQLINAVSVNTAVDSQVAAPFQPVMVVLTPYGIRLRDSMNLIGEKAQPYMQAVLAVGTALQNLASSPPGQNEGPAQDAKTQAAAARNAALNITLAFAGDPASLAVGAEVRRLLTDPLARVDPMLGNVGVAGRGSLVSAADSQTVAAVRVEPANQSLMVGETRGLEIVIESPTGGRLDARSRSDIRASVTGRRGTAFKIVGGVPVRVSAEIPAVVRATFQGGRLMVTGLRIGRAEVRVTVGAAVGAAQIAVTAVPVARIQIEPNNLQDLEVGKYAQLQARLEGPDGAEIRDDRTVIWSSSSVAVARVGDNGLVWADGPGTAVITATAGGQQASVAVRVNPAIRESDRPSVEYVLRQYARAMSEGDLQAMLAVFPSMPAQMRNGYQELFRRNWTMSTSEWRYLDITIDGTRAEIVMGGTTSIRDAQGRATDTTPFPRHSTLQKQDGRWLITAIE